MQHGKAGKFERLCEFSIEYSGKKRALLLNEQAAISLYIYIRRNEEEISLGIWSLLFWSSFSEKECIDYVNREKDSCIHI